MPTSARSPQALRAATVLAALAPLVLTVLLVTAGPALGQDTTPSTTTPTTAPDTATTVDPAVVAQLQTGSEVYSQICSACHQPGGAGLPGQYPPLAGNPKVADAAYVTGVITNGKQGEITVLGQTYNGVMPSFSTLSDGDIAAVIAYIQNGFTVPGGGAAASAPTGPVAGTELPALTNMSSLVAWLLAAAVIGLVLAPRLLSTNDRLNVPWLDAGLKTATIVTAVVLLVVVVPDWALRTSAVSRLSRPGQDLVGVGLWGAGLLAVLWGLWYAHRESRV